MSNYLQPNGQWHPTPVLLPGKSHGRRSLGCSPWGHDESDTTEQLHFDFSLSCIGEGNGNPLQCSCLENPRDGGAWWASVCGVAQSQTRLKWLSSSSSSRTVTHQAPLFMRFFKPEDWSSLPCPPPGIFLIQWSSQHLLCFLHWPEYSLPLVTPGKPLIIIDLIKIAESHLSYSVWYLIMFTCLKHTQEEFIQGMCTKV